MSGWRLPRLIELFSIVELDPDPTIDETIDATAFPNPAEPTNAVVYWTSDCSGTCTATTGDAWFISFYTGGSAPAPVSDFEVVRCVR